MNGILEYNGYQGDVNFDLDSNCLYGKILFIDDLITYEAGTIQQLQIEFTAAVNDYIQTCAEIGKEPEKPFKGTFNVRIGPELHREAAIESKRNGIKLNDFVKTAIINELRNRTNMVIQHIHEHHVYKREESLQIRTFDGEKEQWPISHLNQPSTSH